VTYASTSDPAAAPAQILPEPVIRLQGVTKTYGSGEVAVHALRGIDLEIGPDEFVVVLGPSGSGKTTLLNLIGGIETPTSGRLTINGVDLTGVDEAALTAFRRDSVGFIFQFFNLVPTLTAAENVELVGELIGRPSADSVAALGAVGLADKPDRFPGALSGGEQQRVAIARAVVKEPPILLADEPTGSLDLDTGRQVLGLLRKVGRDHGRTIVLVTHNQAIAGMADRVVRMRSGQIVEDQRNTAPTAPEAVTW